MTAKLRRLALKRFRSLQSADIWFDNPTFLVGQNGAGKSNIVDAFSLLADAMVSPLSAVLDKRGGIGAVRHRSTSRGRPADMGLRIEVEDLAGVREAMYAFAVRATRGGDYKVQGEQGLCVADDGARSWFHRTHRTFRSNIETQPALAASALALPLVAGEQRLAPLARFLSDIQPYRIDPRTLREMQDPDAGVRLRSDGGNAASVLRQLDPSARQHLQEFLQTVVPGEVGVKAERVQNKLSLKFTQQGEEGALRLGPHNMSDGTLRTLGLLAAVFQPKLPSVLIVEEPEATIHPGALGTILDLLRHAARSTQTVITTHSPDILEARWIEDRHLRIVGWEDGATRVTRVSEATRTALREHMMDAGELLRGNALLGTDRTEGRVELFDPQYMLEFEIKIDLGDVPKELGPPPGSPGHS